MVNDEFVVVYMHDAHEVVKVFKLDGSFDRDIQLPALGSVSIAPSKRPDKLMFLNFTSFTYPQTVLKYDFAGGQLSTYSESKVKFAPDDYETKQVFVTGKDGTKVPLFITHKKTVSLDGTNPTILTGYGGFRVSETPAFSATRIAWLEQGGIFAQACMRGGGEYGEDWHQAGMLDRKQNVFDDFQSCAQWLIDNNYTSRKRLAVEGRSNGGLLVGACINQRPDLFGAALCGVPLTDMLRYDRFSVGRFWTTEYGSSRATEQQFKTLLAYSPLHNVKEGASYPPTLITTAEGDDRVVPLHARKFTATLQAKVIGGPIFLRTETKAGHGGGKPIAKQIDESADMYAFLAKVFEMKVPE
jgi:prolyl oligopeptidase